MLPKRRRRSLEQIAMDDMELARLAKQSPAIANARKFDELCDRYFETVAGSKEALALVRKIRDAVNGNSFVQQVDSHGD